MREPTPLKRAMRKRQSGVAAIEFAIVFPVFFLVLYALVGYAFVFLIQSGLQSLASEATRQAVAIKTTLLETDEGDREALLEARLGKLGLIQSGDNGAETEQGGNWLIHFDARFCEAAPPTFEDGLLTLCLQADFPLPTLDLLGISIPGTPDPLTTTTSVFLD